MVLHKLVVYLVCLVVAAAVVVGPMDCYFVFDVVGGFATAKDLKSFVFVVPVAAAKEGCLRFDAAVVVAVAAAKEGC